MKTMITTERLILREMRAEDFDALYKVLGDAKISRYYPYAFDEARVRDWIERNILRCGIFGFGLWAVCLKETGEMIGDCGLTMQPVNGLVRPEIGYHIRADRQMEGFAKEAAKAVRDWTFRNTPFGEVFSYMTADNLPSRRTAMAYGASLCESFSDDQKGDLVVYSLKRSDWQSRRQTELKAKLAGKKFSVFGDSISTFPGVNTNTNVNSTLGGNATYYTEGEAGICSASQTWWHKFSEKSGMGLLVNNSSSGAKTMGVGNVTETAEDQGIGERTVNLHADRGPDAGKNPDAIIIFMGTNDANGCELDAPKEDAEEFEKMLVSKSAEGFEYKTPETFGQAYFEMLHKIRTAYPDADIYCMTVMPVRENSEAGVIKYNRMIRRCAFYFGMDVIDLYGESGISWENRGEYLDEDLLHPREKGMEAIAETAFRCFEKKYLG